MCAKLGIQFGRYSLHLNIYTDMMYRSVKVPPISHPFTFFMVGAASCEARGGSSLGHCQRKFAGDWSTTGQMLTVL